ncbi:MAG: hypothetical protein R6U89_05350 [Dehalococcoidia bacterium]
MEILDRLTPIYRLILLGIFIALIVDSASEEYDLVQGTVRFICVNCLGLTG